jgi:hypothetical protein
MNLHEHFQAKIVIFFIFAIDEFGHAVTLKVKAALKKHHRVTHPRRRQNG